MSKDDREKDQNGNTVDRRTMLGATMASGLGMQTLAGCAIGGQDQDAAVDQLGGEPGGMIVPPSEDGVDDAARIQEALEDVAPGEDSTFMRNPYGVVRLQSGADYQLQSEIRMPIATMLDFNGARGVFAQEAEMGDAITVHRMNWLRRPYLVAGEEWRDGAAIKISTDRGKPSTTNPAVVSDLQLRSLDLQPTGTKAVHLHDEAGEGIAFTRVSGFARKPEIGIHCEAVNLNSWINSNSFEMNLSACDVGVRTEHHSQNAPIRANQFNIHYQPSETSWVWDLEHGEDNVMDAVVWDPQHIKGRTIWRIGGAAGRGNVLFDRFGQYSWSDNVHSEFQYVEEPEYRRNIMLNYFSALYGPEWDEQDK